MTDETHSLALKVDATQPEQAASALDKLALSAKKTETAADSLVKSFERTAATLGKSQSQLMAYDALHGKLSQSQLAAAEKAILAVKAYEDQAAAMTRAKAVAAEYESQLKAMGLGLAAAAAALGYMMHVALEHNARMRELSETTGIAADDLAGYGYAAATSGTSIAKLTTLLGNLSDRTEKAAEGSKRQSAIFDAMGISIKDASGHIKAQDQLLLEIADKFAGYKNGVEKAAIAQELFGRGGRELIPLLNKGSAGIEELKNKYKELTGVNGAAAERANEFSDMMAGQRLVVQGLIGQFNDGLIPALSAVVQELTNVNTQAEGFRNFGQIVGDAVVYAAERVIELVYAFRYLGTAMGGVLAAKSQFAVLDPTSWKVANDIIKEMNADLARMGAEADAAKGRISAMRSAFGIDDGHSGNRWSGQNAAPNVPRDGSGKAPKFDFAEIERANALIKEQFDALLRMQNAESQAALQSLEQYHRLGLISEQQFLEERERMQRDAAQNSMTALRGHLEADLAELNAVLSKSLPGGTKEQQNAQAEKQRNEHDKILKQITEDYAKLGEAEVRAGEVGARAWFAETAAAIAHENALSRIGRDTEDYVRRLGQQVEAQQFELGIIGKTNEAQQQLRVEFELTNAAREKTLAIERQIEDLSRGAGVTTNAAEIAKLRVEQTTIADQTARTVASMQQIIPLLHKAQQEAQAWSDALGSITDTLADDLLKIMDDWRSGFRSIWEDFSAYGKKAIAEFAAKTLVINVTTALSNAGILPGAAGLAAQNLGGQGITGQIGNLLGLGNMFGPGSAMGGIGSAFSAGYAGAGVIPDALGVTGAEMTSLFGGAAAEASGGIIAGLQAGLAAVPVAGWVALGALVIAGIVSGMDDGPAQRSASFGSNAGLGSGDPMFRSQSALGTFGVFNDQWFSEADQGESIKTFLASLQSIDNAIAGMLDSSEIDRVKNSLTALTTTFEAGMEHEATSFGDIMLDRYRTVARSIDGELGDLVDGFTGTGEELTKFTTGVVAVYKTLQRMGSGADALFGQHVTTTDVAALTGSGGDVAATFQELVAVFTVTNQVATMMGKDFTTAFGKVGLESKDLREDFIALFGGMQQAQTALQTWANVGFTALERQTRTVANGTTTLNSVFGQLNIAIPQTWTELNTLIDAQDLTTEAGRQTAAMLINQAVPAFAAVHGTAEDAAQAMRDQAAATQDLHDTIRSFMTPEALRLDAFSQLGNEWTKYGSQILTLSNGMITSIPASGVAFANFLLQLEALGPEGAALAATIAHDVTPAVRTLNSTLGETADKVDQFASSVGNAINAGVSAAQKTISQISSLAQGSGKDFGGILALKSDLLGSAVQNAIAARDKINPMFTADISAANTQIATLQKENALIAKQLAQYTILSAQYDSARAEQLVQLQSWYDDQKKALKFNAEALIALDKVFDQRWKDIVNGVATGVNGTLEQLMKLRAAILDYVNKLRLGDLSPLTPMQKYMEAQTQFRKLSELASHGDVDALGKLTSAADDYLRNARNVFASSSDYVNAFNEVLQRLDMIGHQTGPATDPQSIIAAAVPKDSPMASQKDVQQLQEAVTTLLAHVATNTKATTERVQETTVAVKSKTTEVAGAYR